MEEIKDTKERENEIRQVESVEIRRISCGMMNVYLVIQGGHVLLIDTATWEYADKIRKAVGDLSLTMILLTHGHFDHTGGARKLKEIYGAPVALHRLEGSLLANSKMEAQIQTEIRPLYAKSLEGKCVLAMTKKMQAGKQFQKHVRENAFQPDIWLDDNTTLEDYGLKNLQILPLPGHTAGSVGFLVEGKHLLAGDAVFHLSTVSSAILYENREQALASARVIANSGAEIIYPGHGAPFPANLLRIPSL